MQLSSLSLSPLWKQKQCKALLGSSLSSSEEGSRSAALHVTFPLSAACETHLRGLASPKVNWITIASMGERDDNFCGRIFGCIFYCYLMAFSRPYSTMSHRLQEAINGGGFFISPRDFFRLLFGKASQSQKDRWIASLVVSYDRNTATKRNVAHGSLLHWAAYLLIFGFASTEAEFMCEFMSKKQVFHKCNLSVLHMQS